MRIVGAQTDDQLAASATDPMASIRDVLPGQTVELLVQAVNGTLQGVASEPILFTLPTARAAGFTNLTTTEEAPATGERTHANGGGYGRVARACEDDCFRGTRVLHAVPSRQTGNHLPPMSASLFTRPPVWA